jgi:hypothetical protein
VKVRARARSCDGLRASPATRRARAPFALLLLLLAQGCGGATFKDGIYENDHARYRIGALGSGWQRMDVGSNDLAFYRDDMGTISVNSTCTEYEDVPVSALVNHLLFDTTERRFLVEEDVTLDGRGARHVIVHAELDGVPIEIELFVMKKDGCVFDLNHVRSRATPAAARAEFLQLVQRFAVLEIHIDD